MGTGAAAGQRGAPACRGVRGSPGVRARLAAAKDWFVLCCGVRGFHPSGRARAGPPPPGLPRCPPPGRSAGARAGRHPSVARWEAGAGYARPSVPPGVPNPATRRRSCTTGGEKDGPTPPRSRRCVQPTPFPAGGDKFGGAGRLPAGWCGGTGGPGRAAALQAGTTTSPCFRPGYRRRQVLPLLRLKPSQPWVIAGRRTPKAPCEYDLCTDISPMYVRF